MYYPFQIPYILSKEFSEHLKYKESSIADYKDFVICFWEISPISNDNKSITNIVIADGCIDLIVDYDQKRIFYTGMSETRYDFKINLPSRSFGARLKPGVFHALTGISAAEALDGYLPIQIADKHFEVDTFFTLPFNEAKEMFISYIGTLIKDKPNNSFITLFDELYTGIPDSVIGIYEKLNYSPRQCQRLFIKNYGFSPKFALCVLRFQKCLEMIISKGITPNELLDTLHYYDQSHIINDFKRHIGITPLELVKQYNLSHFYNNA